MSTDNGYIKLQRKIRDHWIWSNDHYLKAWIDLIMMMNYEDTKILFDNKPTVVKRGSRITSIRKLAERWNWSSSRVKRFLDMLERDGMINTVRNTRNTTITVINYGFYQDQNRKSGTLTGTLTSTQTSTLTGTLTSTLASYREGKSNKDESKSNKEKEAAAPISAEDDDDDGMTPEEYMRRREAGEFDDI